LKSFTTISPNYCIQEHRLICGIDEDYGGSVGWFKAESKYPAEGRKVKALERYFRMFNKEPENWTRRGYEYQWRYTGISFLTMDAANDYVSNHRHTYEIRVYVKFRRSQLTRS